MTFSERPYTYLYLDAEILAEWAYFESRARVLSNTDLLFLNALRPYWEHYLPRVTYVELASREVLENLDDSWTRAALLERAASGRLVFAGRDGLERAEAVRTIGTGEVALLSTDESHDDLAMRAAELGAMVMRTVVLPRREARLEIEPAWKRLKAELYESPPALVLLSLGWEKVVYAPRLLTSFGATVVDIVTAPGARSGSFQRALGRLRLA